MNKYDMVPRWIFAGFFPLGPERARTTYRRKRDGAEVEFAGGRFLCCRVGGVVVADPDRVLFA